MAIAIRYQILSQDPIVTAIEIKGNPAKLLVKITIRLLQLNGSSEFRFNDWVKANLLIALDVHIDSFGQVVWNDITAWSLGFKQLVLTFI